MLISANALILFELKVGNLFPSAKDSTITLFLDFPTTVYNPGFPEIVNLYDFNKEITVPRLVRMRTFKLTSSLIKRTPLFLPISCDSWHL